MIDRERRFIFVHIPKTAGSSVTSAFGHQWQNHKDIARYQRELGEEEFRKFFKLSIVRNPWDRLLSDYCYQTRLSGHRATKLHAFNEKGAKRDFASWVRKVLSDPFAYPARMWGGTVSKTIHRWSPQLDWICIDGAIAVDYVGRMERLEEDFGTLCEELALLKPPLSRKKKTMRRHYSEYYDDATRELVATYYQEDIKAFGYSFDQKESRSLGRALVAYFTRGSS